MFACLSFLPTLNPNHLFHTHHYRAIHLIYLAMVHTIGRKHQNVVSSHKHIRVACCSCKWYSCDYILLPIIVIDLCRFPLWTSMHNFMLKLNHEGCRTQLETHIFLVACVQIVSHNLHGTYHTLKFPNRYCRKITHNLMSIRFLGNYANKHIPKAM